MKDENFPLRICYIFCRATADNKAAMNSAHTVLQQEIVAVRRPIDQHTYLRWGRNEHSGPNA
jgi:hypothetical protein